MTTGRDIRALRRQRGLTLDELSALSGVHRDDLGAVSYTHLRAHET